MFFRQKIPAGNDEDVHAEGSKDARKLEKPFANRRKSDLPTPLSVDGVMAGNDSKHAQHTKELDPGLSSGMSDLPQSKVMRLAL